MFADQEGGYAGTACDGLIARMLLRVAAVQGRQQLQAAGQPLDAGGVYSALLDCVAARNNTSNSG